MTAKPSTPKPTTEDIVALERRVWDALVSGDPQADKAMLSCDFLGVYPSGFSDRDGHTDQLVNGPVFARYHIEDARLMWLADDLVLLAYRGDFLRVGRDTSEVMYISSIWRRHGKTWQNCFSQDSKAEG